MNIVVSVEPRPSLSRLVVSLPVSAEHDAVVDGEGLCCRTGVGDCRANDGPSMNKFLAMAESPGIMRKGKGAR